MKLIRPNKAPKIVRLDIFVIAILILILFFAFSLVGGLLPENFTLTKYSDKSGYTPLNPEKSSDAKQGLQLELIKLEGCSSTAAVNFLIDRSGSMGFDGGKKMTNLQNALLSFKNKLSDDNIYGLQAYSQPNINWYGLCSGTSTWCNVVNPSPYGDVKTNLKQKICALRPQGGTYTRDAFLQTEKVLDEAIKKYPDHKFNLIFISDGIPEDDTNNVCPGGIGGPWCGAMPQQENRCRCYSIKQDPTNYYDSSKVDIPQRIKDKGVRIFTISYIGDSDKHLNNLLEGLMERVASSTEDFYKSPSKEDVDVILELIVNKICKEAN